MFKDIYSMESVAKKINDFTFTDYYFRLTNLARSVFEWSGLPNNMSEKWIEKYLFTDGQCVFYEDEKVGLVVCRCSAGGTLNEYDEPTTVQPIAHSLSSSGKSLKNNKECVVIYNNDSKTPTQPTIKLFAYRLADITRTADINIHAQKTPILLYGADKKTLSLKNIYKKWTGNEPVIHVDENAFDSKTGLTVLKTEAPVVFDKLRAEKNAVFNECMTFLGIDNANMDKKERLVADEVSSNNEQIEASAYSMLKAREEACEQINKLFGTNISVKMRDFKTISELKGGVEDGTIHSNSKQSITE